MQKVPENTIIYFLPGLAAGPEIFEGLTLNPSKYKSCFLEWMLPLSENEKLENYAKRFSKKIIGNNIVLVGVSFGGILAQEIAKIIPVKKVIIISSVKSNKEFPFVFKMAKATKLYKLFPTKVIENFDHYSSLFVGKSLKKKANLYEKYLSVRENTYLKWGIKNTLHWKQDKILKNITHVHGTEDSVFPIKNIDNVTRIEGGNHAMIITKAKKISTIIDRVLTC